MKNPPLKRLRRAIRYLAQRSTHTGELPGKAWCADELVSLLTDYGLAAARSDDGIKATHRFGREYTLHLAPDGVWHYATTTDPIDGISRIRHAQNTRRNLFGDGMGGALQGKAAPAHVWWDGRTFTGKFIAFDLETTPITQGEFPEIVVASAGDETGDAFLLTKDQITPWLEAQFAATPDCILCNWNLAAFDLPTCIYRIPGFRERVFPAIEQRIFAGRVLDTEIFTKLRDIALQGGLLSAGGSGLGDWQHGWGKAVYGLGPQAKRFLGVDVPKGEGLLFWRFLDNPHGITEEMAAYALNDAVVTAALQKYLYEDPFVWEVAASARQEIGRLNGRLLQRREGWTYDPLLEAANLQFGWQTHTIQFLGSVSLSWNSIVGVEVDIDHAFRVIAEKEEELFALRDRFAGRPCAPVYRVFDKGGEKAQERVGWVREGMSPERVIAQVKRFHEEWADDDFVVGNPESFRLEYTGEDGETRHYRFVSDKGSISEKSLHAYLAHNWETIAKGLAPGQHLDEAELKRIGLQGKAWAVKFGVDEPADVPDPALQLKFQIAALQKAIATVKTYLPGVATHPDRDKLTSMHSMELRRYVEEFIARDPLKGRFVFPSIKALGAASARTAGGDPNLQQVERADRMRNIFIAPGGYVLVVNDYGAAEMVTQAEIYYHRFSNVPEEKRLAYVLNQGYDVHILTGMKFRFPTQEEVWRPILADPLLRDLKRSVDADTKRQLIAALRERPHPLMQDVDPNSTDAGEDIAKDLWIDLLAEAMYLTTAEGAAAREAASDEEWAAVLRMMGNKKISDADAPPSVVGLRKMRGNVKRGRQAAKPINFGLPGGMKPAKIVISAKTDYKVDMTLKEAEAAFDAWMKMYPEGVEWLKDGKQPYFRVDRPGFPSLPYYDHCWVLTGRLRGKLLQPEEFDEPRTGAAREKWLAEIPYDPGSNEWHNTQFQGLCADGAKLGDWYVWREGIEKWNFVHDEIGSLSPVAVADETQAITTTEMLRGMSRVLHYTGITVGGGQMQKWCK